MRLHPKPTETGFIQNKEKWVFLLPLYNSSEEILPLINIFNNLLQRKQGCFVNLTYQFALETSTFWTKELCS